MLLYGRLMLRTIRISTVTSALALAGCDGALEAGPWRPGVAPPTSLEDAASGPCTVGCVEMPGPTSEFPRLSHAQWENTTRDLLRMPDTSGLSSTLSNDEIAGGFDNDGTNFSVSAALFRNYESAAESLWDMVSADGDLWEKLEPSLSDTATPSDFISAFGGRAYRRPLTDAEKARYLALYQLGVMSSPELPEHVAGSRPVIQAMLESPHFLYRVERGTGAASDGMIRLNDYEIASRLSYALWNTMPDEALFAAASRGELVTPNGIRRETQRLLADPRAHRAVVGFHAQLLEVGKLRDLNREVFADFAPTIGASMRTELERFVEYTVFDQSGTLSDLLTSRVSFVDAELARLYGVEGTFGTEPTRVELEGSERAGILTRASFLAIHASGIESDAIHRGISIARELICATLQPPGNVTSLPDADPNMPLTMRQRIDRHTGAGTCGEGCHTTTINPLGFAFESYDGLGRFRTHDRNSLAVDSSTHYQFPSTTTSVPYADARSLSEGLAGASDVHRCYAMHWIEFLQGRRVNRRIDGPLITRVATASQSGMLDVRSLITEVVASPGFMMRSTTAYMPVEGPEITP